MQIVKPSYKIITPHDAEAAAQQLGNMELIARTCYKSTDKITDTSGPPFLKMLIDKGHHAMLEHSFMQVHFVTDRGITHEIVRHRLCAYAQESTRWCDYGGKGIQVVCPGNIWEAKEAGTEAGKAQYGAWTKAMCYAESYYDLLRESGCPPGDARSVLPTCLKTELVVSTNFREWRHIFTMRTPVTAHPDMRRLMIPLLVEVKQLIPTIFDDL